MTPSETSLIADMRAWAAEPGCICYTISGPNGPVAIFKDDIESRDDELLLAFVRARCAE